ncbi:MAG: hypothetical protein MUP13_16965, partial [Thermoanaerobaculales bacterium]|nr:hypothetical protein [Thermoanaerobaculales bacterium]
MADETSEEMERESLTNAKPVNGEIVTGEIVLDDEPHLLDPHTLGLELPEDRDAAIQLLLTEHRAQRGLCQLAGRIEEILHLDNGLLRVDDAKVEHGIDLHRDIV